MEPHGVSYASWTVYTAKTGVLDLTYSQPGRFRYFLIAVFKSDRVHSELLGINKVVSDDFALRVLKKWRRS